MSKTIFSVILVSIFATNSTALEMNSNSFSSLYEKTKANISNSANEAITKIKIKYEAATAPAPLCTSNSEELKKKNWKKAIKEFEDGIDMLKALSKAPESAWIGDDKKSINEDFDKYLQNDILPIIINDNSIKHCFNNISKVQDRIKKEKLKITSYTEEMLVAPEISRLEKTKDDYKELIAESRINIRTYENNIDEIFAFITKEFKKQGQDLNKEDTITLLARVDRVSIVRMSIVYDFIKNSMIYIEKSMELLEDNSDVMKKYYAMNVILSKLIVYMQNQYILEVENKYQPRLKKIMNNLENLVEETEEYLEDASDDRIKIYRVNLESQQLTLKVSKIYEKDLQRQIDKTRDALDISNANLRLSMNTYKTMQLSSDLLQLLKQSKKNFAKISSLQKLDFKPFENKKIQEEYLKMTAELQKD